MNKKQLINSWIVIIVYFLFLNSALAWTEYKEIRYIDLNGDMEDEVIIEAEHGAGIGHYIEDMRIFEDKYPALELLFFIRTIDEYFVNQSYQFKIISDVQFTEPNLENGVREIIVKSRKIYYKDDENKVIDKEEDLGTKIFKWNGKVFEEKKDE